MIKVASCLALLVLIPSPCAAPSATPEYRSQAVRRSAPVQAVATGYCLTGRKTSTDKLVYAGCIALSDSLRRKLKARYGDKIVVEGIGTYVFDDRSPQKFDHADIHFPVYRDAYRFGLKKVKVWKVG